MKAFLILDGTLGSQIVPLIHNIPQLHSIYVFSGNKFRNEQWVKEWIKIKGVHIDIKLICEALQLTAKQFNQDSIAVSFFTASEAASNVNLNQLEPSFMYTHIFKDIFLGMKHNEQSSKYFTLFRREHYTNNTVKQNVITEFQRNYSSQSSIKWYTRESFIYQRLNRALRMLEVDPIINMGFFIHDLHQQLEEIHKKQIDTYTQQPFILYKGQGSSRMDFEKLRKSKGGLMAFHNFLSTSKDPDISLCFAESALGDTDTIGILYKMTVDLSVSSAPFASIREVSDFQMEDEILFSIHTVFRIDEITKIDNNSLLYQADLTLTADYDKELRILTDCIRKQVVDGTGWQRLGQLLIKLTYFDKAEELYTISLEQTSDEGEKALYYHYFGCVKHNQGSYEKAIEYYKKRLEIWENTLPPHHPSLATSYSNIDLVYDNMGEYFKALSF